MSTQPAFLDREYPEVPASIVELLRKPLPAEAVHQHPTKKYLSTIKVPYVIERLNDAFGLNGWQDTYNIISDNGKMVVVQGFLYVPKYGITRNAFGGNDNEDRGDAYKGACTDALSKMASFLGIGADVYKGMYDNGKKPPQAAQAAPPAPPKVADGDLVGNREKQHTSETTADGHWPTTVEGDRMKCFVIALDEKPGKFANTCSLEVRHMKRDGSEEVGTKTGFTKVGSDLYQLVKSSLHKNAEFQLEKKGQYINIVSVLDTQEISA